MESLLIQALTASRESRDCRRTIDTLQAIGLRDDAFPALHHQHGSKAVFYSYCGDNKRFMDDGNNHRVHQRLIYVLRSCLNGAPPEGKTFQILAEEAYQQIPPIQ